MKKVLKVWAFLMIAALLLTGCGKDVRPPEAEKGVVRIYDVESQDQENVTQNDFGENAGTHQENVLFQRHEVQVGLFTTLGSRAMREAPYYDQISSIEKACGVDIDYVMLGSWEELRQELEKDEEDSTTKLVLFNNSYDKSLMKEMLTGQYEDMEDALEKLGFYDEEKYEQTVLSGGRVEGFQVLVPLLYNVSGAVHGETLKFSEEMGEYLEPEPIETSKPDFSEFISMLEQEMNQTDKDSEIVPFLSAGFLEGNEPDLFLNAAGIDWSQYEEQEEIFNLLYHYLTTYQKTQVEQRKGEVSLQSLWVDFLNAYEYKGMGMAEPPELAESTVRDLYLTNQIPPEAEKPSLIWAYTGLMENTTYFVECSSADDIAYHSVIGTLSYRNRYNSGIYEKDGVTRIASGKMGYWPIGTYKEGSEYAAQPISYAAVVKDGDVDLAARVIQGITDQYVAPQFGFSINKEVQENQLSQWSEEIDMYGQRSLEKNVELQKMVEKNMGGGYWTICCSGGGFMDDKPGYADQLREQLDNVAFAQIPDREILAIWQDTLTEAVASDLSAEAGFKLLCERMDEWWK